MASGKQKLLWLGAAGCIGLPILGVVALVGLGVASNYLGSQQGVASIREQLAEIKRGEMDKAYRRMADTYRAMNDPEDFVAFVAAHPALKDNRDSSFWNREYSIDEGSVVLRNAVLTSSSGVREVFTYRVQPGGGILIEPVESKP